MEEQGYIELRVTNKDNTLSPKDIDINEVKDFIQDVESFLYPNRKEKQNRPHICLMTLKKVLPSINSFCQ